MIIVFIVCVCMIVYTYFLYPLMLSFLSIFKKDTHSKITNDHYPSVTMVIAAYNEENVLKDKIRNCIDLDYPSDKLNILIGSDGSTDSTNKIIKNYVSEKIKLVELPRSGKCNVLNKLIPMASGEIIVLSDANTMYQKDSIKKLVVGFQYKDVGCVCGKLRLMDRDNQPAGESLYWKYETFIKNLEGLFGAVIGSNGGIYAIRKNLFTPLPTNTIVDDFFITCKILEKGYRCIYQQEAIAYEEVAINIASEFKRKVRISKGNFQNLFRLKKLLNPTLGLLSLSYWSHKVIRWFVPILLIIIFLTNMFLLQYAFFRFTIIIQILFYLLSYIGYLMDANNKQNKIVHLCYYLTSMNVALLFGLIEYVKGIKSATWHSTAR